MKICFVGNLSSAFIKNDYTILNKYFDLEIIEPPKTKIEWLKYPLFTSKKVKRSDVIFCWFAGWHSAVAIYYAKRYNKKSIIIAGGYDAAYAPEINYGAFSNIKEKIAAKYVFKNTDLVLAVSNFTKNEILDKVNPKKIELVYNGVDIEKYKGSGRKDDNLVLTIGAIKWNNLNRKGIETFVKVAQHLPETRFVVIGKPLDDSINYLKSIAFKNVEFTGFISDAELLEWYQKAKVICQLSYYEAFGLTPAEGMACGCIPVVTKERNGMGEFVGDIGFYVPFGDEKVIAEAIQKALNTNENLGKKSRERIKDNFSLDARENKLKEIISDL